MKNLKFKIVLAFLFVVVFVLMVSVYFYNKPHVDVKKSDAAYFVKAQNLIEEYQENEEGTTVKYSESVIEVQGTVFEISTLKGNSVITLKDDNTESSIICHMLPDENRKALALQKGQNISIKGICTGYLMDVIMVRCTLGE